VKSTLANNRYFFQCCCLIIFLSCSGGVSASENNQPFQQGIDFSIVDKTKNQDEEQLSDLESVSNIELFYWIGCESCYQVELGIAEYIKQNASLTIRRTPLVARPEWRSHAYIPAIISQLSGLDDVPSITDVYKQCLTDCATFQKYESSLVWFAEQLKPQTLPNFDGEQIWQSEKNFQKRADIFSITQVPTIIINERYKITAKQAKTPLRLVEIIDYLITSP